SCAATAGGDRGRCRGRTCPTVASWSASTRWAGRPRRSARPRRPPGAPSSCTTATRPPPRTCSRPGYRDGGKGHRLVGGREFTNVVEDVPLEAGRGVRRRVGDQDPVAWVDLRDRRNAVADPHVAHPQQARGQVVLGDERDEALEDTVRGD